MSSLKEKEAKAFREWFVSQQRFNSLSAMERALNITKDYLKKIKNGTRRATDPILRQKLFEATGSEIFGPIENATSGHKSRININSQTLSTAFAVENGTQLPDDIPALLGSAMKKLGLTLNQCAERYGISYSNLKKYKMGVTRPASEKNVASILNIIKDAKLSISDQSLVPEVKGSSTAVIPVSLIKEVKALRKKIDQIDTRLAGAHLYQNTEPEGSNAKGKARRIMQLILSLSNELEFFKTCSEDERAIFKRIVPGQDVGYLTTLLRALYDEDKFQRWLLFSTYEMKGKENGE